MFKEVKNFALLVEKCSLKIQKGEYINYLGYKIGLQKIEPQKVQIRRNKLQTHNDFQKWWAIITGYGPQFNCQLKNYLCKPLQVYLDLNSIRKLSAEAERELCLIEKKLQDAYVNHFDPYLYYSLIILLSMHSLTGILM